MNTELFKKIHDQIESDPSEFGMSNWEDVDRFCGTTRCLAGWAIHLTTGKPIYTPGRSRQDQSVYELAKSLGVKTYGDDEADLECLGGKLLGLEGSETQVFYVADELALEFIRLAAEGRDEDALDLLTPGKG